MKTATIACAAGLFVLVATATEAGAFWQRSQVSMCADATTEAERLRWRCAELGAYADPGWPDFWLLSRERNWIEKRGPRGAAPGGVTRRLG